MAEAGFKGSLFIILSHGGMAPVEEASRLAAGTVLSGPAGGVSGARRCADLLDIPDLVPFDMGGTRTDISLISEGRPRSPPTACSRASASRCAASISPASRPAAADRDGRCRGTLRVGPESAGSVPGPACYGNGGRPPPSPTPMSCSAISMPPPSWAARARSIAPPRKPPSTASPRRWTVAAGGRRRHPPDDQPEHGRWHPPDDATPWRRSKKVRAAQFWRRGGPACGRSRARTRDQAHHRADGRLGARRPGAC